jgi:AraC family transcriptional regulator
MQCITQRFGFVTFGNQVPLFSNWVMPAQKQIQPIPLIPKVESAILYQSDFYQIKNWTFDFEGDRRLSNGFNDCLCVVFVKRGQFHFDLSAHSYDMHTGHIVIDKPNYEYTLRPATGECSIFNFINEFYRQITDDLNLKHSFFFSNPNILSLLLKTSPETEYLHYQILKKTCEGPRLEMDNLVLELLKQIIFIITNSTPDDQMEVSFKTHQLSTIERAKAYINEKFATDISLYEISSYSHVSPFHFSRIFKKFTSFSPYQYLLNVRLKHSELLLKNTSMLISEISFSSGFNSAEHFATAFKQRYGMSPTQYRK